MKLLVIILCTLGLISCAHKVDLRSGSIEYDREHSIVAAFSDQHWFMYTSLVGEKDGGPLKNGNICVTSSSGDTVGISLDEEGNLVEVGVYRAPAENTKIERYTIKTDKEISLAKYIKITKNNKK